MNDFSVFIGGKAGDGIDTSSLILARILNQLRYYIYVYRDYPSIIRGGHTFSIIRASLKKVSSHNHKVDFILALNIKSALLHEIGDMVSSIAVVLAGVVIFFTGNYAIDPVLSFFICILIVIWAIRLLIESGNILLEATPKHLDIDELIRALKSEVKGVHEVHHIHAWTIASAMYALTAHVVIDDCQVSRANETLDKINGLLKERFNIEHTNIQFECLIKREEE